MWCASRQCSELAPGARAPGELGTNLSWLLLQFGLHDRLRDRRGDRASRCVAVATTVFDHNGNGDPWLTGWCEGDEPGVWRSSGGVLGGARLAGNLDAGDLGARARAVLDHVDHHLGQLGCDLAGYRLPQDRGLRLIDDLEVGRDQLI